MELTVVLAGIPVRLSLRSPAYAACFQPFCTEADPVAAVRVPEGALAEAAPRYEAGTRTMSAQPVHWRSACWRRCPSGCCKTAATRPRPLCAAIP